MKYYLFLLLLFCNSISAQEINQTEFYGKEYFLIEGTIVEDHLKESPYDRLPISYKELVRTPVWNLSKSSAGISIRFWTNTSNLKVKWEVINVFQWITCLILGLKELIYRNGQKWQYINTGRPQGFFNEYTLIENMDEVMRNLKFSFPYMMV